MEFWFHGQWPEWSNPSPGEPLHSMADEDKMDGYEGEEEMEQLGHSETLATVRGTEESNWEEDDSGADMRKEWESDEDTRDGGDCWLDEETEDQGGDVTWEDGSKPRLATDIRQTGRKRRREYVLWGWEPGGEEENEKKGRNWKKKAKQKQKI